MLMVFVEVSQGAPEGLNGRGSAFNEYQQMKPRLKVSSDKLGESRIKLGTPGYKASD